MIQVSSKESNTANWIIMAFNRRGETITTATEEVYQEVADELKLNLKKTEHGIIVFEDKQ